VWVLAGFLVMTLPFAVLLAGERPPGGGFLWNFSMGLGFGAMAMFGLQFVLTARFRRITHPFGVDVVYFFHRIVAIGAVALALVHFGIIYIWRQDLLDTINPLQAPLHMTAGRVALVCFIALVVTSEFRKQLRLEYGLWRYLHVGLAVVGFGAAVGHILGAGHFTQDPAKRALWLGVTLGFVGLTLWVRVAKPWMQMRNPWRVADNVAGRGDVHSLVLEPLGAGLGRWKPGQFVWLTLFSSPFALREHPFTIASASEEGPRVTLAIKPLGDFTRQAVAARPGERAYLDGPFGTFSIDNEPEAEGFVMIAGGIGITPMLANLRAMRARGDRRPVALFYCNSDWEQVAFREELEGMTAELNLDLVHVLENPPDGWTGESGFLSKEILARRLAPAQLDHPHFLCGPPPMIAAIRKALLDLGTPMRRIDAEIFDLV